MKEIQTDFLKRILFGGTLEDKLAAPSAGPLSEFLSSELPLMGEPFSPNEIHSLSELRTPGRSGKLSLDRARPHEKSAFPKSHELKIPSNRGRLLHYFANHELLAIETMAFVLLRFPDADAVFRTGVLRTLQDEQRHLGQYVKRMQDFGVELGDFPLNLYFWNTLRQMRNPLDFVTQMSLTFEQANLDFALFYANLFQTEIDDELTGKLLKEVHDDEIKHVAHGMKWFDEWRDQSVTEYESYLKILPYPMTPRRARGGAFFAGSSRASAGMSKDFIESVRIAGGSRGKVPNYFYFNPQAELESTMEALPQNLKRRIDELAPVMLWLAQEEDVVELPCIPELSFQSQVFDFKGALPEIVTATPPPEKYAAFDHFKPWGFSKSAWKKLRELKSPVRNPPNFPESLHAQKLFSKVFWRDELAKNNFGRDHFASDNFVNRVDPALDLFSEVLIKVDQSTSGRGHLRIPRERLSSPEIQDKLERIRKRSGNYVIEPFYPKIIDFSIQYEIKSDGSVVDFEPRFFKVDHLFQYQGAVIGKTLAGSAFEGSAKAIDSKMSEIKTAHAKVIDVLKKVNYVGPFGIDALTYQHENGEIEIAPVIEVNARYTMGRVALEIERIAQSKKQKRGVFRVMSARDLLAYGARSFAELEKSLRGEFKENFVAVTPSSAKETWAFCVFSNDAIPRFLLD
jgi:uncharacterized ferritin-like protein (DUF455 family)